MKILVILLFAFWPLLTLSQKQETLSKFIITESTINGKDKTDFDINRGGYFVFYKNDKNELCFANYSKYTKDQSYGRVHNLSVKKQKESSSSYKSDIFNYRWKYYNTYDANTGYATITLIKIYKPQGIAFSLRMILPNLDVSNYKGYMEGSLNLEDY